MTTEASINSGPRTGPNWLSGSISNLLGAGIPFAFAIVCMPLLLHGLGPERYGLLVLAWAVVGYFSIFDFGLSRAITQLVAKTHGESAEESAAVVGTGILVLAGLGVVGGLTLYLASSLVSHSTRIPPSLRDEAVLSMRVLGIGLPFVIISTGLRGALEGVFDFTWMNIIRVISGIGTYLTPVIVMSYSVRLQWICAGLVLLRALSCVGYYLRCRIFFRLRGTKRALDRGVARRLLGYGGWITVSNLVSPIMAYLDRFLIAGVISIRLAGYYSTSQDIVTKFQIIPAAILAVVFPAISRSYSTSPQRAGEFFLKGTHYVTYTLFALAATCVLFAREGLAIWFGPDFANQGYQVAQILTIGSFVNCLAFNPYSFLQGIGRPDITAKIHLIELPIYLLILWFLTRHLGVLGVAIAWSLRMCLDLGILLYAALRQSPIMREAVLSAAKRCLWPVAILISLIFIRPLEAKILAVLVILGMSLRVLWTDWRSGDVALLESGT